MGPNAKIMEIYRKHIFPGHGAGYTRIQSFSTEESAIMSAGFRGFTLSLQENLSITSRLLPSKNSFRFALHQPS
jgi:hypothetical protein